VRNEAPLPEFLVPPEVESETESGALQTDLVWAAYFRHIAQTAQSENSPFLDRWVRMEVALRNAVAHELADPEADFTEMLREWASAPTPLAGWRVVLRNRWDWCRANEAWFSFTEDELLVYALRLLLLTQWQRSSEEQAALAAKT
jgi:hypothetical protein